MIDSSSQGLLMILLLPGLAIIGIALNLFIRARGGRSFSLKLKALGIELQIDSTAQSSLSKSTNINEIIDDET